MRAQIILLLLMIQVLAHVATMAIVSPVLRSEARQQDFALDLSEQFLLVLPLLPQDATSSDRIVETVVSTNERFFIRPSLEPENAPQLLAVEQRFRETAPPTWAERLYVYMADWSNQRQGPIAEPFEVAINLSDGWQLVFSPELTKLATAVPWVVLTFGTMLIAMPIMILSVWAGNTIVRPITTLADGADAFAQDINAPRIDVNGAPEVRRAARSVNGMRDRIRKLLRDRSLTLAAISHDMRTPLTRMRLRLENSDASGVAEVKKDLAELERMTDDALRFLRAEEEVARLRRTDVAVLCKTVCDEFSDQGADIKYNGPHHAVSYCDPALMRRVLENTIGNAIRHAGSGLVCLRLPDQPDDGEIAVEVVDDGPGIAHDQIESVLRPFSRLDAVKAGGPSSVGGFGLGLAIAKQLMARQNGELSLHPNAPKGLIVRLLLPSSMPAT